MYTRLRSTMSRCTHWACTVVHVRLLTAPTRTILLNIPLESGLSLECLPLSKGAAMPHYTKIRRSGLRDYHIDIPAINVGFGRGSGSRSVVRRAVLLTVLYSHTLVGYIRESTIMYESTKYRLYDETEVYTEIYITAETCV